jgi:hypothetical protein
MSVWEIAAGKRRPSSAARKKYAPNLNPTFFNEALGDTTRDALICRLDLSSPTNKHRVHLVAYTVVGREHEVRKILFLWATKQ